MSSVRASTRGHGRIFQRPGSAFWWCSFYLNGKEHRESTGQTDEQKAQAYLKRRLKEAGAASLGLATFVSNQQRQLTVGELLDALVADLKLRGKHSPQVASHLKPVRARFGDHRAVAVTAEMVDAYIQDQLAHGGRKPKEGSRKGAKPATVNRSTQLLAQAFRLAIERQHLSNAPAIRRLPEENVRQGFFTEQEFRGVIENLPGYLKDFALFGYLTGWRKGEIASLRWQDVDGDVIRLLPENSKNGEGLTVPLVGELADLMERRKAARRVKTPTGFGLAALVFHHGGRPIVDLRKSWATATKLAGVPGRLLHDLRRCAVRNLVRAGVPQDVARSITGHKTASVFSRYNIVAEDQKREALLRTQAYLTSVQQRVLSLPPAAGVR